MDKFAVIGLGLFGTELATLLADAGAEVIAIDKDPELVEALRDKVAVAVCLDSADEQALLSQGIDKVDVAIVGIGTSFEASALTTVILKQLGVPRVISRATSPVRADILARIGADSVINPEHESAERWSSRLLAPAVMERFAVAEGHSLAQVMAPEAFHNKTLQELDITKKYGVLVVAIRRKAAKVDKEGQPTKDEPRITAPGSGTTIRPGDVLVIIGKDDAIHAFPAD